MTAKLPHQTAVDEALAERAQLVTRMNDLTESRRAPAERLKAARETIEKYDRGDARHPEVVVKLVKARADRQQAENDLEVIDGEFAALFVEIKANDETLQALMDGGFVQSYSDLSNALRTHLHEALAEIAPAVAAVVRRACAINAAIGGISFVNDVVLAAADNHQPLVARSRLRIDGPQQVEFLDQTWRSDPALVTEFETLRSFYNTVNGLKREIDRIRRERESDPEWQKKRFAESVAERARESEENVRRVAEGREREAREEAEREERFRNVPRNGMEIRMPGTPAPGEQRRRQPQMDDAIKVATGERQPEQIQQ